MLEMFGLKKPFPKMMVPKAMYNKVVARSRLESKMLALKNRSNCPIAIKVPPSRMQ